MFKKLGPKIAQGGLSVTAKRGCSGKKLTYVGPHRKKEL